MIRFNFVSQAFDSIPISVHIYISGTVKQILKERNLSTNAVNYLGLPVSWYITILKVKITTIVFSPFI